MEASRRRQPRGGNGRSSSRARPFVLLLQHCQAFQTAPHCRADRLVHTNSVTPNWGRVMTSSLLSSEPIQGHFAAMEITDGDFHRVEVIGDLTCRIEIVDDEDDKMRGNGLKSPLA